MGGVANGLLQLIAELQLSRHLLHLAKLILGDESDGDSTLACTAGAAGAVNVILGLTGGVEVDHLRDAVNVYSAGGYICCDQCRDLAILEIGQCALALALALVAVHRCGPNVFAGKPLDDSVGAALGADEDEVQVMAVAKLADKSGDPRVVGYLDETVLDVRRLLWRRNVLVTGCIGCEFQRDLAGFAVERGREEERLAVLRAEINDAFDCRAEAHVEHPVGLIEDEDLDVVEAEGSTAKEVLEPSGRCHDDVRFRCRPRLLLEAHAAVDGRHLERAGMRYRVGLINDLCRQLACWGENQRRWARIFGRDQVDQRHHECERLAGAGWRFGKYVFAGEYVADDLLLNCEGRGETALL